jgi:hypothetical protein
LSVVLYGCGAWSLALREESRFRMLVKRMLRKTFGPKKEDIRRAWRKLHITCVTLRDVQ